MHLCFFVVEKVLGAHKWLTSGGRLGRKWRLIRCRCEAGTLRSTAAPQRACSNFSYLRVLVETRACPSATPSEDRPVELQQALDYVDRPAPTRSACLHFLNNWTIAQNWNWFHSPQTSGRVMLSAKTQPTVSCWIKPFNFPYLRPPPLNSSTHPKGAWVEVKRSRLALSRNITLTGAPLKYWHVNIMYLSDSNLQNTFCPASDVYPSVFCQFSSFLNLDLQYLRTGSSIWNVALRTDRTPFPYGFQWKKKIFILFLLLPYVQGLRM